MARFCPEGDVVALQRNIYKKNEWEKLMIEEVFPEVLLGASYPLVLKQRVWIGTCKQKAGCLGRIFWTQWIQWWALRTGICPCVGEVRHFRNGIEAHKAWPTTPRQTFQYADINKIRYIFGILLTDDILNCNLVTLSNACKLLFTAEIWWQCSCSSWV